MPFGPATALVVRQGCPFVRPQPGIGEELVFSFFISVSHGGPVELLSHVDRGLALPGMKNCKSVVTKGPLHRTCSENGRFGVCEKLGARREIGGLAEGGPGENKGGDDGTGDRVHSVRFQEELRDNKKSHRPGGKAVLPDDLLGVWVPNAANCAHGVMSLPRYNVSQSTGVTMAATTMVHVRVDEQIKAQATETLASMGLTVSDAVRVFLMRVVADKQMPFAIKAPNAETRAAMIEADEIARAHSARFTSADALFDDLEKNSRQ